MDPILPILSILCIIVGLFGGPGVPFYLGLTAMMLGPLEVQAELYLKKRLSGKVLHMLRLGCLGGLLGASSGVEAFAV